MEPTHTNNEQEASIRWLLENRRPEISRDQTLRILRMALTHDRLALHLLDQMALENDSEMLDE